MFKTKWWFIFFAIILFAMSLNQLAYLGENTGGRNFHIAAGLIYLGGGLVSLIALFIKKFPAKK